MKLTQRTVIVCLSGDPRYDYNKKERPEGFITEAEPKTITHVRYTPYNCIDMSSSSSEPFFRLATEKEIQAYKKGIQFIKDIPKDEIINEYQIY